MITTSVSAKRKARPELEIDESILLLYVDLFSGAGGTSTGVEEAVLDERQGRYSGFIPDSLLDEDFRNSTWADLLNKKVAKVIACVNHDENAIASHAENHPEAIHFTENVLS